MNKIQLIVKNILHKPLFAILSILLLSFGVAIVSGLLQVHNQFETQFKKNVKDIDLVIGAKGSPLQLILSSVLHIDNPTGNIPLAEAKKITKNIFIERAVPVSIGDSYQGVRIVGTTEEYLSLYEAKVAAGVVWTKSMEVCIGANVAKRLGLKIGDIFHGSHGLDDGHSHDEHDLVVVGIIAPSNSVIDDLILTSLETVWDVHHTTQRDITAMLLQFKNALALMQLPRYINAETTMQAAVPIYETSRLFKLLGVGLDAILWVAYLFIGLSGLSLFVNLYHAINERKREFALMRIVGASRMDLLFITIGEALLVVLVGFLLGMVWSRIGLYTFGLSGVTNYYFTANQLMLTMNEVILLGACIVLAVLAALLPAMKVYRLDISKTLLDE